MIMGFKTHSQKLAIAIIVSLIAFGGLIYVVSGVFAGGSYQDQANTRWFVCTDTLKSYKLDLSKVQTLPAYSPFSGKNTGQPAELCYWNADGSTRKDPTPVLLNSWRQDPSPTFCPDCGRLVIGQNPAPDGRMKPPPTKAEYEAWMKSRRR